MALRHFLTLTDLSPAELEQLIQRAIELKAEHKARKTSIQFPNYVLGMVFEKSSTRTRISFEAGMAHLGGHAIFLSSRDTQLGRGEPIEDSAKVISSMCDIVMIRTFEHDIIERFAANSRVPVINALTDDYHPCQLLADIQTFVENRGSMKGKQVAWVGDGNNMCQSYINAAVMLDFKLMVACPEGFDPRADLVAAAGDHVEIVRDPVDAARGSDLLVTDVWASMGQEEEKAERRRKLAGYQINRTLMDLANPDALYMHCLPAKRGEEISAELMDDPNTVIWDEAENRLHAQKALLEFLLKQAEA
ncbi:Ornithine carbamoyltransferase 1, anabolic [Zhongshania aliphaticivorans]|uniref:Ornithine carbamoyltransferase n=1 Tax=Zhongshania aliphaticivorans TaxID=1470434 RepID=A0A5S9MX20_9GAMM|nr:ornithine carbamoyltransferase [Zhongshania aliphaticivorans]CAA0080942.1 Ornithine carbamoyltransferase 1, anabolic [Zhongshania aliphaticivorans]CAA0085387.1 Ornithine carbamoyltransferase 1, anabolic [Zhongshania aliphaticivorans]